MRRSPVRIRTLAPLEKIQTPVDVPGFFVVQTEGYLLEFLLAGNNGKTAAGAGKQLASSCRGGQTIVKQLSNSSQTVVRGQGQGRGIRELRTMFAGEFAA